MVGVAMFSDVGIEQSIIHNKRGNDPAFVNTAWTVKVIRGVLMWLVLCLLAAPLDVGSYAFGLLVTIVWAWIDRTRAAMAKVVFP